MSKPLKLRIDFEGWMREVDRRVEDTLGLSTADLPDCCYRDWYDEGMSPREAAAKAMRNAQE